MTDIFVSCILWLSVWLLLSLVSVPLLFLPLHKETFIQLVIFALQRAESRWMTEWGGKELWVNFEVGCPQNQTITRFYKESRHNSFVYFEVYTVRHYVTLVVHTFRWFLWSIIIKITYCININVASWFLDGNGRRSMQWDAYRTLSGLKRH